jgi:hypothetical protein
MLRALEARVYDTNNRAPQEPAVSKVSLNFIYTRHFLEFETTRAFTFMVQWK